MGGFLQQNHITRVYSSPLERCRHTAALSSDVAGATYQIDGRITEWQPGENEDDVQKRLNDFLEAACWRPAYNLETGCDHCVMVSHGGPIAMFLLLLGLDPKVLSSQRVFDHGNPLPPGGVWQAARSKPNARGGSIWFSSLM